MVDDLGIPRVRCACGNPLAEPEEAASPEFSGEQWQDFDSGRLAAVAPAAEPIETFELTNVNTGETYEQAAGGVGGDPRDLVFDFGGVGSLQDRDERRARPRRRAISSVEYSAAECPCCPCARSFRGLRRARRSRARRQEDRSDFTSGDPGHEGADDGGVGERLDARRGRGRHTRTRRGRREPPVNPAGRAVDRRGRRRPDAFVFHADEPGATRVAYMSGSARKPDVFEPEGCI